MKPRFAMAFALSVCACRVDEAAEVATYREILDRGGEPAGAPRSGASLGLRDAMLCANATNERLAIEGEAYLRAIVDRRRIAGDWLPRIELSPSYFVRDRSGGSFDGLDLPITGRLAVNPKGTAADSRRAEIEIERRRALLYGAQDALLLDVAQTLFTVVRAERSATVLRSSLEVQEARVDDVRARRDVGFARPLDVSLSESSAANARVQLIDAESQALSGRALLAFLTGVTIDDLPLDATLIVPAQTERLQVLVARATEHRPEVGAALLAVEAAVHTVELASAQWWPSLSIDLAAFFERDSNPTDQEWSALFAVRLPLFDGGRIRADVCGALSFLREAKYAASLTTRAVARDVAVAVENLRASRERIAELSVQLASAREALAQADGLYDAGLATNLERLAAQSDELRTELALESAGLELELFYLDQLRTTGTLHEWVGLQRERVPGYAENERAEAR